MSMFLAALNSIVPHFRVRGHILFLSQAHPLSRIEIDLRRVAAHKMPGPAALRLRFFPRTLDDPFNAGLSSIGGCSAMRFTHTLGERESPARSTRRPGA